ncbi:hypothetical protein GA0115240_148613 [Streptomyces sp. DvalAA-14]|uniref:hypothetical protein n=1 Tax=unclassified Streptomyces TaxID=2593676 RepID=UPI00081AEC87|nr:MULTISPECIES: hypothetical protein [unclassified Streptomyces]MYS23181.1 hypothetical protein [Streptomyces sp. SID4948]SCE28847.1 hypothetical protein GA0115240_148613 [Streptomyces sp. DvalAA-14]
MRPRLLPHTHLLPSDQGVVIRGPQRTVALPMPGIYPWLERIRPFLDGSRRLDELVADLAPQAANHVRALVELLVREGFVRDAEGDLRHGLSPEIRTRHAALIDFIALRADSPEYHFERYRNCAPVVVGFGRLASALVLALLTSGVEQVRLCIEDTGHRSENRTDLARLDECVELLRKENLSFRYEAAHGEPQNLPADTGVALLACDTLEPELAARVRALAAREGVGYGQLTASGRHAFISVRTEAGAAPAAGADEGLEEPGVTYLGGPNAALAANQLCLRLLCQVAGLDEREDSGGTSASDVAVLDLATGRFLTARPA